MSIVVKSVHSLVIPKLKYMKEQLFLAIVIGGFTLFLFAIAYSYPEYTAVALAFLFIDICLWAEVLEPIKGGSHE